MCASWFDYIIFVPLCDAYFVPDMRTLSRPAFAEVMMASAAARCSSRWITVVVSSGHRRAAGALVCNGSGGMRSASTLAGGRLWRGESLVGGAAGSAVTLKGLSG